MAAHVLRTVNAAVAEGITSLATVHDSFGVCRRGLSVSARSFGSSSFGCTRIMTCWLKSSNRPVRTWVRTRRACLTSRRIEAAHAREYLAPMLLSGAIEIAEEILSEFLA